MLPLILTIYFLTRIPALLHEPSIQTTLPWSDILGVALSFSLDGLSILFALVISFIGTLIMIYAGDYLEKDPAAGRFFSLLLTFMASMLGVVLSSNIMTLFVFWELTSLSSFLLIGFYHDREKSRKSALQALLVTSIGGLAMLAGFLLLGSVAGSYEFTTLLEKKEIIKESKFYLPSLVLILLGAFTKSAQFPFHFWLPNAMTAPSPVSAYLHSATMVKAGIYLLARFSPILGGTSIWFYTISAVGSATMLVGSALALFQKDLKLLLAYMTIMALGALTMLLGIGSPIAFKAAMVFFIVHSLYKGALFLVAGAIEHETATRDVLKLSALRKKMPILAGAATVATLSMAGLPPLFGFIGKELIYKAALDVEGLAATVFIIVAVLSKAAAVAVAGVICVRPFFLRTQSEFSDFNKIHEPPAGMLLGPLILGVLGLIFGLWPELIGQSLIGPAVKVINGTEVEIELHVWPELNMASLLSVASIALGLFGYFSWKRVLPNLHFLVRWTEHWGAAAIYERGFNSIQALARIQTAILQSGSSGSYLAIIFSLVTIGAAVSFNADSEFRILFHPPVMNYIEWTIVALIVIGSVFVLFARSLLATFAALGVIGYSIALVYVIYGAPDLAITQIFVETLTIVIATLVIGKIPEFPTVKETKLILVRDAVIASGFGLTVAALLSLTLNHNFDNHLSRYFSQQSVPGGFGRNIVNVILVDFRALDTLGEITVVAVAALGIYALLKSRIQEGEKNYEFDHPQDDQ